MFNVCDRCGLYAADMTIECRDDQSIAVCPSCGHTHPFLQLPLYIVTGASGTGKSTVVPLLAKQAQTHVVLDTDILWESRYNTPEDNYRAYREMWLRIAKNINQSGRPVVLCGTAMPEQLEPCLERRYFSVIHYLALTCDEESLCKRLRARPTWRSSQDEGFVYSMTQYNKWLKENASCCTPPITLLDTSNIAPDATARDILDWVRRNP